MTTTTIAKKSSPSEKLKKLVKKSALVAPPEVTKVADKKKLERKRVFAKETATSLFTEKKLVQKLSAVGIECFKVSHSTGETSFKVLIGGTTKEDGDFLSIEQDEEDNVITFATSLHEHIERIVAKRVKIALEEV